MRAGSRITSRTLTLLAVAAAHGLALWALLQVPARRVEETEAITSVLLWPSVSYQREAAQPSAHLATSHPGGSRSISTLQPPVATGNLPANAPIALPDVPEARVDWTSQLTAAADATLNKEKVARDQANVSMRKYRREVDPLNPGRSPYREFRWSDSGTHRIDTRGPIPGLWLNDRCILIAFIMPACKIGHIDIHDDLFQNMGLALDEREATPRPNDVP